MSAIFQGPNCNGDIECYCYCYDTSEDIMVGVIGVEVEGYYLFNPNGDGSMCAGDLKSVLEKVVVLNKGLRDSDGMD